MIKKIVLAEEPQNENEISVYRVNPHNGIIVKMGGSQKHAMFIYGFETLTYTSTTEYRMQRYGGISGYFRMLSSRFLDFKREEGNAEIHYMKEKLKYSELYKCDDFIEVGRLEQAYRYNNNSPLGDNWIEKVKETYEQ